MKRQDAGVSGGEAGRMVVGLDIDGTITRHPGFFAFLTGALMAAGHRVVIITFREDRAGTEAERVTG